MSTRALGVIPARIASSRLPHKPLYPLAGRPLIEWVWRRVVGTGLFAQVVIATDDDEIVRAAECFGARAVLTSPDHPSGTDRVAEVAGFPGYASYPFIVNIQGDEPFVRGEHLERALELVVNAACDIGTVATPVTSMEQWRDPAAVKVVLGAGGRALFFSRAPIPFRRDGALTDEDLQSGGFLRHIGIYAYRREALLRWVSLPEGELERIERLEQLRPLAAGIPIGVAVVAASEGDIGIDTPADAAQADRRLRHETSRALSPKGEKHSSGATRIT